MGLNGYVWVNTLTLSHHNCVSLSKSLVRRCMPWQSIFSWVVVKTLQHIHPVPDEVLVILYLDNKIHEKMYSLKYIDISYVAQRLQKLI